MKVVRREPCVAREFVRVEVAIEVAVDEVEHLEHALDPRDVSDRWCGHGLTGWNTPTMSRPTAVRLIARAECSVRRTLPPRRGTA
jgi:hypothetical protein